MKKRSAHILIAGAGLGGLTLALGLIQNGFRVTILEQAKTLNEVGAGIQVSANGTCVLHALGLGPALAFIGIEPEGVEIRHWKSGDVLMSRPLSGQSMAHFGFPHYRLH